MFYYFVKVSPLHLVKGLAANTTQFPFSRLLSLYLMLGPFLLGVSNSSPEEDTIKGEMALCPEGLAVLVLVGANGTVGDMNTEEFAEGATTVPLKLALGKGTFPLISLNIESSRLMIGPKVELKLGKEISLVCG